MNSVLSAFQSINAEEYFFYRHLQMKKHIRYYHTTYICAWFLLFFLGLQKTCSLQLLIIQCHDQTILSTNKLAALSPEHTTPLSSCFPYFL